MLKMVLAAMAIAVSMAAAQTSAIWNGTANTSWYNASQTTFTITTAEQLAGLAQLVNNGNIFSGKTITLGANIMLNDTTNWQNWENNPPANSWVAIGNDSFFFGGTFNGNGFVVNGVFINTSRGLQGLFGFIGPNGTITNLGVVASLVRAGGNSGGLVGLNIRGEIRNSYFTGNFRGVEITNGGLVGFNDYGTISNSYSTGSVRGLTRVGGLVGSSRGTISNSYSIAMVEGTGGNSTIGGLLGNNYPPDGIITNSYYNSETSGQNDNRGFPRTTAQMKTQSTFTNWDFTSIWTINPNINNGYPYLRIFNRTITFNSNGGSAVSPIITKLGTTISRPSDPTRNGYTFAGWFRNADGTNEWNFANDRVTTNLTLHARWTPITYNITYHLNGGTNHSANPATFDVTTPTITLQAPTKTHFTFAGWWTEAIGGSQVSSISVGSTGNRVFHARWTPITYTITFNTNDGTAIPPVQVNSGDRVAMPPEPTKPANAFLGWFRDEAFNNSWSFTNDIVAENITLFAKWGENGIVLIETYTYDGTPKRIETIEFREAGKAPVILYAVNDDFMVRYDTCNINAGVVSVRITPDGAYAGKFIGTSLTFTIHPRPVNVIWENTEFFWNGEQQAPTAKVDWGNYPLTISGHRTNIGDNYTAIARLTTPNPNIVLLDTTKIFTINKREIEVEWEDTGPFTFNWTAHRPTAKTATIRRDDGSVVIEIGFAVQGEIFPGDHWAEAKPTAPTAITQNLDWKNHWQPYKIQPRPLTPRLRNTPGDTIKTSIRLTKELLDSILTIEIDFDGFATNTQTMETDGKSVLDSVRFHIQNDDSQHSLRSQGALALGEHIVTVSGGSQNYTILPERKIVVIIGERFLILENYPRDNPTAICDVKKSDNRYGIKFAINPVSEKAEISVILPNNEHIANANVVIYDMTGNVVFSTTARDNASWDLRNTAGRFVANGTYLVIVEVKDRNGKVYVYSAKLGVKR